MKMHPVKVLENKPLSQNAFLLKTKRFFDFIPGQSVAVTTSSGLPPRLYSICSGSNQNEIAILYKVVDNGKLTPQLAQLKPGSTLFMSMPTGSFTHKEGQGVWIASGTGIAPFISMLESDVQKPALLLYGSRTMEESYYNSYLSKKLGPKFIPCISRLAETTAYKGRITDWLKHSEKLPMDLKYYLCGSPEMVVDARDILIEKGVGFKQIASEIYF